MRLLARCGLALGLLALLALALDRAFPPELGRLDQTGSEVLDRSGRPLALLPAAGGVWRFRTEPQDVSPAFLDLLIATEDRRFRLHPGVDPVGLARAAVQFVRAGRVVSGGSTLAMQAARLLHPRPRTVSAKLIEIFRALQLEAHYGHSGVLRIWLTLAPYGGNLEGVRAGSLAWFGCEPDALEPAQAALLVAIPRRPEALRPDRHPQAARLVRDRVLPDASGDPAPASRIAFPHHAPQFAAGLPRAPRTETTLDLPLQAALERLAAERLETLPERASLAVLVADVGTREVRAIYSGDSRSGPRAGSLDLTRAIRSPGSSLKPFLYALAFQDGIAGPQTVLTDMPRLYAGYAPEDFDRGFEGELTAAEALRRSLNLPAVALLEKLGPLRFAEALRAAGAPLRLPRGAVPSLPLALGGAGTTLRDAASLYAALAGDGDAGRLRATQGEPREIRPFLHLADARTAADVLTRPFPGGGPAGVAWKTGTSWGGRDAWAFGFDARQVVAVWIGRPDDTPMPGATGASLALPLLARVFDLLPPAPRATAPEPPPEPAPRAASGPRLLFPPPGAVVSGDGPMTLRVMGGRRPLTFLVDGAKVASEQARREALWQPPGPGFYRVTVLDADGLSARASVRVAASATLADVGAF